MTDQRPNEARHCLGQIAVPCLLVVVGVLAHANSLHGPFLFDDKPAIVGNDHIRQLWPPTRASAPPQSVVAGRPVVSFTLAVNVALGGLDPRGYRVLTIAVHVLCALVLYGFVQRSLSGPMLNGRFGRDAPGTATAQAPTLPQFGLCCEHEEDTSRSGAEDDSLSSGTVFARAVRPEHIFEGKTRERPR